MASIERPAGVAAVLDPFSESDDRLRIFETARGGATRGEVMDAVDTGYDVADRYLDEFSDTLLAAEDVRGRRVYAPTPLGRHIGTGIDAYRERMDEAVADADPDAYLGTAVAALSPGRITVLDHAVEEGEISGEAVQELLDLDPDPARSRTQPLIDAQLLSRDVQDSIIYTYSDLGEQVRDRIDATGDIDLPAGFRAMRNGQSYRVLLDWEELDSMAQLGREADVSNATPYNWRDALVDAGYLEEVDDGYAPSPQGDRFREAFQDLSRELPRIASALQSTDRLDVFRNADGATRRDIAEQAGTDLQTVRNIVRDIESRGLLEQEAGTSTRYRPGPRAGPVHHLLRTTDAGLRVARDERAVRYLDAIVRAVETESSLGPAADELGVTEQAVGNWYREFAAAGLLDHTGGRRYRAYTVEPAGRTAHAIARGDHVDPVDARFEDVPEPFDLPEAFDEFLVLAGILPRGGDMDAAADLLDVHPQTARDRLREFREEGYMERSLDRSGRRGSDAEYTVDADMRERFGDAIEERVARWAVENGAGRAAALGEVIGPQVAAELYRQDIYSELRTRLGEDAATAATIGATVLAGGTMHDAASLLDVTYQTALRYRDDLLVEPGLLEMEGHGRSTDYRLDPGLADTLQRYLEVAEPEAALQAAAGTAVEAERDTGLHARMAHEMETSRLVDDAELPDQLDIWLQLDELLLAARTAADDPSIASFGDYIDRSRDAAEERLDALEERGALMYRPAGTETEFTFAPWTRDIIDQYADSYGIETDALTFDDLTKAHRRDLFDSPAMFEDVVEFTRAAIHGGGISTFQRYTDVDREEARRRYERLADEGYVTRHSSGGTFIFDTQLRPLLREVSDRFEDEFEPDVDPLETVQFRNIEELEANRQRMSELEVEEDETTDLRWTDYDGDAAPDEDDEPVPNGHGVPAPDRRLEQVDWYTLADRPASDLAEDIDDAMAADGEDLRTVNQAISGDLVAVRVGTTGDTDVVGVAGDGRVRIDADRYHRAIDGVGSLEDDYLVVAPGDRNPVTGFYGVEEIVAAFRPN